MHLRIANQHCFTLSYTSLRGAAATKQSRRTGRTPPEIASLRSQ
jgi:hypothetical protein